MGPYKLLPLWVCVYLGVEAMNGYSVSSKLQTGSSPSDAV